MDIRSLPPAEPVDRLDAHLSAETPQAGRVAFGNTSLKSQL
jgi:hypothetical protein